MENDGLIMRYRGSGRSKVEVELTDEGRDVFSQSLHNETDKTVFSVLTPKERERLASSLWKVRRKVLQELGIPEWHLNFPLDPDDGEAVSALGPAAVLEETRIRLVDDHPLVRRALRGILKRSPTFTSSVRPAMAARL